MGNEEEVWRKKNADTHLMSDDKAKKAAGVEESKLPLGCHPGEVLHQRRRLPYSYTTMAVAGFLITGVVGYFTLYLLKKPDASARDVAKVATGVATPKDTHPSK